MDIDHYLDKIRKENKEIVTEDPITASILVAGGIALTAGTIYNISKIVAFLIGASVFHKVIKVDAKMSKKLNEILKTSNEWVVHKFPDMKPNAFAINGKHVFITTGLIKLLDEREQYGVLLHEAFHNKDLHMWKRIATKSALVYLIIFVSITSTITIFPGLGILVAFILRKSFKIAYARMVGRRQEIKADEFAVKYGFGNELISALNKIEKWAGGQKSRRPCGKFCQLEKTISSAIDEHPSTKKRVEIILRKVNDLNNSIKSMNFKKISKFVIGVFKNNG